MADGIILEASLVEDDFDLGVLLDEVADGVRLPVREAWFEDEPLALLEGFKKKFDKTKHPRWPKGTPPGPGGEIRAGQFMKVGQRFVDKDGKLWEVAHILNGRIYAHAASGKFKDTETKAFKGKGDDDGGLTLDVKPAAPAKITGGKSGADVAGEVTTISPYVQNDHDPSIPIPPGSPIKPAEWARFGRLDQEHYIDCVERFGKWSPGSATALYHAAFAEYDSAVQNLVKSNFQSQFGSSSGYTLSLTSIFSSSASADQIAKAHALREKAKELQGDLGAVIQWDLYHRTQAPDIALFHKQSVNASYWNSYIQGKKAVFSGLSQSHSYRDGFFGGTALCTPTAIRHVVLATASVNIANGYKSEMEVSVPDRMLLDDRSFVFTDSGSYGESGPLKLTKNQADWLQGQTKQPASGALLDEFKAKWQSGDWFPAPPAPANIVMEGSGGKQWLDPPAGAADATKTWKVPGQQPKPLLPSKAGEDAMYANSAELAKAAAGWDIEFQTLDQAGLPQLLGSDEQNFKPGDYMLGKRGTLYWVGSDPGDPSLGLRYHEIENGVFNGKSYNIGGGGKSKFFKISGPKGFVFPEPVVKTGETQIGFETAAWSAEKTPEFIGKFKKGDKFKSGGNPYELLADASMNQNTVQIVNLETGKKATINTDYKAAKLVANKGYVEPVPVAVDVPIGGADPNAPGEPNVIALRHPVGSKVLVKTYGNNGMLGTVVEVPADEAGMFKIHLDSHQTPDAYSTFSVAQVHTAPASPFVTDPEVDDTFSSEGKKFTITSILKDGTVRAKPMGGGPVQKFAKPYEGLDFFRPSAWEHDPGSKKKVSSLEVGQLFDVGAGAKLRPAVVTAVAYNGVTYRELDTGKTGKFTKHKMVRAINPKGEIESDTPQATPVDPVVAAAEGKFDDGKYMHGPAKLIADIAVGEIFMHVSTPFMKTGTDEVMNLDSGQKIAAGIEKPAAKTTLLTTLVEKAGAEVPVNELVVGDLVTLGKLSVGDKFGSSGGSIVEITSSSTNVEGEPMVVGKVVDVDGTASSGPLLFNPDAVMTYAGKATGAAPLAPADPGTFPSAIAAGFDPYKSKYGSGGKYVHEFVKDMPAGTHLRDKSGKEWIVKQTGDVCVLSDGESHYSVPGLTRGRVLDKASLKDSAGPLGQFTQADAPEPPVVPVMPLGGTLATYGLGHADEGMTLGEVSVGDFFAFAADGKVYEVKSKSGNTVLSVEAGSSYPVYSFVGQGNIAAYKDNAAEPPELLPMSELAPMLADGAPLWGADGTKGFAQKKVGGGGYQDWNFVLADPVTGEPQDIAGIKLKDWDPFTTKDPGLKVPEPVDMLSTPEPEDPLDAYLNDEFWPDDVPLPEVGDTVWFTGIGGTHQKGVVQTVTGDVYHLLSGGDGIDIPIEDLLRPGAPEPVAPTALKDLPVGTKFKNVTVSGTVVDASSPKGETMTVIDIDIPGFVTYENESGMAQTVHADSPKGGWKVVPLGSVPDAPAAPADPLTPYTSPYGSGGKYKHERLEDLAPGTVFKGKGKAAYTLMSVSDGQAMFVDSDGQQFVTSAKNRVKTLSVPETPKGEPGTVGALQKGESFVNPEGLSEPAGTYVVWSGPLPNGNIPAMGKYGTIHEFSPAFPAVQVNGVSDPFDDAPDDLTPDVGDKVIFKNGGKTYTGIMKGDNGTSLQIGQWKDLDGNWAANPEDETTVGKSFAKVLEPAGPDPVALPVKGQWVHLKAGTMANQLADEPFQVVNVDAAGAKPAVHLNNNNGGIIAVDANAVTGPADPPSNPFAAPTPMVLVPYASAYGSGGKYKHTPLADVSQGSKFRDKAGKVYTKVGQAGSTVWFTDADGKHLSSPTMLPNGKPVRVRIIADGGTKAEPPVAEFAAGDWVEYELAGGGTSTAKVKAAFPGGEQGDVVYYDLYDQVLGQNPYLAASKIIGAVPPSEAQTKPSPTNKKPEGKLVAEDDLFVVPNGTLVYAKDPHDPHWFKEFYGGDWVPMYVSKTPNSVMLKDPNDQHLYPSSWMIVLPGDPEAPKADPLFDKLGNGDIVELKDGTIVTVTDNQAPGSGVKVVTDDGMESEVFAGEVFAAIPKPAAGTLGAVKQGDTVWKPDPESGEGAYPSVVETVKKKGGVTVSFTTTGGTYDSDDSYVMFTEPEGAAEWPYDATHLGGWKMNEPLPKVGDWVEFSTDSGTGIGRVVWEGASGKTWDVESLTYNDAGNPEVTEIQLHLDELVSPQSWNKDVLDEELNLAKNPPGAALPKIPNYDGTDLDLSKAVGAGGTQGAKWATGPGGTKWLVKQYKGDEDRVATELLGNAIYREMGAKAAPAGVVTLPNGKKALTYEGLDGAPKKITAPSKELGDHYMTDALLANWDFIGATDDNILWGPDGKPFRVDQGGVLFFRAQGTMKPFSGHEVKEVESMLKAGQGQGYGKVVVTQDGLIAQAKEIGETMTDAVIDSLVDSAPFSNESLRESARIALKGRVDWMRELADGKVKFSPAFKEQVPLH